MKLLRPRVLVPAIAGAAAAVVAGMAAWRWQESRGFVLIPIR